MSSLENAIWQHDFEAVQKILLENPSAIDETDENGSCMALLSAKAGDFEILRYVVEYSRASMNIYDREHRNILHYGVMSGNPEIVKYLVERVGMNPLSGDINLVTPFDLAHPDGAPPGDPICCLQNLCWLLNVRQVFLNFKVLYW